MACENLITKPEQCLVKFSTFCGASQCRARVREHLRVMVAGLVGIGVSLTGRRTVRSPKATRSRLAVGRQTGTEPMARDLIAIMDDIPARLFQP
jgi:hypothetical protein